MRNLRWITTVACLVVSSGTVHAAPPSSALVPRGHETRLHSVRRAGLRRRPLVNKLRDMLTAIACGDALGAQTEGLGPEARAWGGGRVTET